MTGAEERSTGIEKSRSLEACEGVDVRMWTWSASRAFGAGKEISDKIHLQLGRPEIRQAKIEQGHVRC